MGNAWNINDDTAGQDEQHDLSKSGGIPASSDEQPTPATRPTRLMCPTIVASTRPGPNRTASTSCSVAGRSVVGCGCGR